jgi:hypothetical protein
MCPKHGCVGIKKAAEDSGFFSKRGKGNKD